MSCPYGDSYGEDYPQTDDPDRVYAECSEHGTCNRDTGECECDSYYEGKACEIRSCPNNCNGHGICVEIKAISQEELEFKETHPLDDRTCELDYEEIQQNSNPNHHFQCKCDSEYSGYSCQKRRCAYGYQTCTADVPYKQTIKFDPQATESDTAYIEYEDSYGRLYYSNLIYLMNKESWYNELSKFPFEIIDLKDIKLDIDHVNKLLNQVTILYGKHQSGRMNPIQILGKLQLDVGSYYYIHGANSGNGFHGMISRGQNSPTYVGFTISNTIPDYEKEKFHPSICSNNGLCNAETGLCECFNGYYGLACTEKAEYI